MKREFIYLKTFEKTILMDIYTKRRRENISDVQKQEFKKLINIIERELK